MKKTKQALLVVAALLAAMATGAGAMAYYSGITETKNNSYKVVEGTSGETGATIGTITETNWDAFAAQDTDGDGTNDNQELMPGQTFAKDPVLTSKVKYDAVAYLAVSYPVVSGTIEGESTAGLHPIVVLPTTLGTDWVEVGRQTSTAAGTDTVVLYRYNKQLASGVDAPALFSSLKVTEFKDLASESTDTIDVRGALIQVEGNATVASGGALSGTTGADSKAATLLGITLD